MWKEEKGCYIHFSCPCSGMADRNGPSWACRLKLILGTWVDSNVYFSFINTELHFTQEIIRGVQTPWMSFLAGNIKDIANLKGLMTGTHKFGMCSNAFQIMKLSLMTESISHLHDQPNVPWWLSLVDFSIITCIPVLGFLASLVSQKLKSWMHVLRQGE